MPGTSFLGVLNTHRLRTWAGSNEETIRCSSRPHRLSEGWRRWIYRICFLISNSYRAIVRMLPANISLLFKHVTCSRLSFFPTFHRHIVYNTLSTLNGESSDADLECQSALPFQFIFLTCSAAAVCPRSSSRYRLQTHIHRP